MKRSAIAPSAAKLDVKPKRRKCKICAAEFEKRSMAHVACSPVCAAEVARLKRENAWLKADRKLDKVRKDKLKTRSDWLREAQAAFNAFIRQRDKGKPCISSGRPLEQGAIGGGYDAGHYRSIGSAPHLRFNENNVHAQSKQDNRYGAGNAVDYRIGLIARIGQAAVDALEADQAPRKYTVDDLKAIKAEYRAKLKALKDQP